LTIRYFARFAFVLIGAVSAACTSTALASPSPRPTSGASEQTSADRVTVPLSEPSRPGLIDISLVHGSITVRGTNRRDVLVTARPDTDTDRRSRRSDPDATGLRRIPQTAGFRITEESNRVKVSADSPNRAVTFEIEAPARTNLKLSTVNGGEILVENVEGELTVSNTNGGITLNGVAGSVIAGTTNGNVRATLTRVTAQKEMAFTSLNGTVDVTLPPTTKANLRLRSNNGDIYSDFDVQLTPSAPVVQENRSSNGRYRISRNQSIVGAINGGGPEFELRTFNSNVYVRKGR
jgi:putative adhesin